jgi:hypothetical protein
MLLSAWISHRLPAHTPQLTRVALGCQRTAVDAMASFALRTRLINTSSFASQWLWREREANKKPAF